jgi:hypothetical protein
MFSYYAVIIMPNSLDRVQFHIIYTTKINIKVVRFGVFTAVTMKNGVFWDVMPCGSCKNRRFGGT